MSEQKTVLVTGGSGYIGSWCVIGLLQQGYTVRTTVRSLAREAAVRAAIGTVVDAQDRLSFHAADLLSDSGWDAAAHGCDYVLHVASPVSIAEPKNPDDLIVPAREGTRRAVGAALRAGVKRVVLTSSVAAASPRAGMRESASDETQWTDLDDPRVGAYSRSKTLAERTAWDLVGAASGTTTTGATTLATVNPSVVLGPVLGRDFSDSVQVVQRLLSGKVPGLPRLGFCFVDVRDVADLHIRAMTAPEADGRGGGPPEGPSRRGRRQGADAPGPGPGPEAGGAVRQERGGRGAAPGRAANVRLGEGRESARLAAASAGRNRAGLRAKPYCREGDLSVRTWPSEARPLERQIAACKQAALHSNVRSAERSSAA